MTSTACRRMLRNPSASISARAVRDLHRGQVDADEGRFRIACRHRNQVAAGSAADFQHAGARDVGSVETEQRRDRGKMVGMRLPQRHALIGKFVVAGAKGGRHDRACIRAYHADRRRRCCRVRVAAPGPARKPRSPAMNSHDTSPLGKATGYPDRYDPSLLFPIDRAAQRQALGLRGTLPFAGADLWTAYEISWLDAGNKPQLAIGELRIPADSPATVESKSLKLYLGSFAQESGRHARAPGADDRRGPRPHLPRRDRRRSASGDGRRLRRASPSCPACRWTTRMARPTRPQPDPRLARGRLMRPPKRRSRARCSAPTARSPASPTTPT